MEVKVTRLQEELLKARTSRPSAPRLSSYTLANGASPSPLSRTNGNAVPGPARPDSRASVSTANTINLKTNGHAHPGVDRHLSPYTPGSNGVSPSQSSVYESRHAPNGYSNGGVNARIHAPKSRYPSHLTPSTPMAKNRQGYPSHYSRANAPSPSPSVVSAAPTLGDDGWYS